jgi:hypothetical protein
MMTHSFQDFSVDIWFCYGSFSYGMESNIYSWENNSLLLAVQSKSIEEALKLESFVESIVDKPKGLIRIELRVFGPEKIFKQHRLSSPIFLYTDVMPKLLKKIDFCPILQFISPMGMSSLNTENWMQLLEYLFNQGSQHSLSKENFYDGRKNNF